MNLVQNFPFAAIMLYLAGGVGCCVLRPRASRDLCLLLNTAVTVMMAAVLVYTAHTGESYRFLMGHFPAPWGNELRIGPLEALLAAAFALVMTLTLLGGIKHIFEDCEESKLSLYFTVCNLLMASLLSLLFTNDLFTGYVFVEINTIASCALVMLRYRSGKTLLATARYLIMSLLGSGMFLLGIIILYGITGHLLMEPMGEAVARLAQNGDYTVPLTVTVALFAAGLALKSALWPFSAWLPDAHANATAASSGILSGLVLKGYIFLLIKIFYRVIGAEIVISDGVEDVLFLFGAGAMVFGSLYAMGERDVKRMLAYSSIAQVGYIYLGIGMGTEAGVTAACVQILVHAVTKPLLFVAAAGLSDVSGGSRRFEELRGAARRAPLAGIAFTVGALSMIGLPLFAGFATKLALTEAALDAERRKCIAALAAIVVSTVLNALYYLPAVALLCERNPGETAAEEKKSDLCCLSAAVVFVILNLFLGIRSGAVTEIIRTGLALID